MLPLLTRVLRRTERDGGFDILYVSPLKALINDQFRRLESPARTAKFQSIAGTVTCRPMPRCEHGRDLPACSSSRPSPWRQLLVRRGAEVESSSALSRPW